MGLLEDISDGGVCVIMDEELFERRTAVILYLHDGLPVSAWVCHSTNRDEGLRLGLSFHPVDTQVPEQCWGPQVCQI